MEKPILVSCDDFSRTRLTKLHSHSQFPISTRSRSSSRVGSRDFDWLPAYPLSSSHILQIIFFPPGPSDYANPFILPVFPVANSLQRPRNVGCYNRPVRNESGHSCVECSMEKTPLVPPSSAHIDTLLRPGAVLSSDYVWPAGTDRWSSTSFAAHHRPAPETASRSIFVPLPALEELLPLRRCALSVK